MAASTPDKHELYTFTSGAPHGVNALMTPGHWLVAGVDGLGVQVVNLSSAQPEAHAVGNFGEVDAEYISSVCLPFDPRAL